MEQIYKVTKWKEGWFTTEIKAECEEDAVRIARLLEPEEWNKNDSFNINNSRCYEYVERNTKGTEI